MPDADGNNVLKALENYPGTLLFVSHDREFVASLATRIIELTPWGIADFTGSQGVEWRNRQSNFVIRLALLSQHQTQCYDIRLNLAYASGHLIGTLSLIRVSVKSAWLNPTPIVRFRFN